MCFMVSQTTNIKNLHTDKQRQFIRTKKWAGREGELSTRLPNSPAVRNLLVALVHGCYSSS